MNFVHRLLPWILVACCVAYITSAAMPKHTDSVHLDAIARLPVSADGRVKPFDTFARNSLMTLSGRQTFDAGDRRAGATEWLIELMSNPKAADKRPVFRIDHPDLVAMLGLQESKRTRFSFAEMESKLDEIARQADMAARLPAKQRDPYQRQVLDLANRLMLFSNIARLETPYMVAPVAQGEEWRPLTQMLAHSADREHPSAKAVISILTTAVNGDLSAADAQAGRYLDEIGPKLGGEPTRARYEVVFNRLEPFYQCTVLYVLALILSCVGFLTGALSSPVWSRTLSRATTAVLVVAFIVHTLGLISRIYLQGRPPVTNLYSSAVFIGWACIPLALVAERFSKLGFGGLVASLIGFCTLIIAHNLGGGGDTMEMMQAVLDSNFWLATHVVVVTIGYSATFLAGFLAAVYIILGVLTPWIRGDGAKSLPSMIYGVVCFATVTSFVGTVLGGIWADQSWGRFWGWDPKENGAALIVFMNLVILHARWGGMIRDRGIAVLAVFGNIVTAWSWFGTNMLGVGLHSYGFMDSAVFWITAFGVSQLAIMGVGLTPVARWSSLRTVSRPAATETVIEGSPVPAK